MKEGQFRAWLESQGLSPGTVNTQMSKVRKLDRVFGDLDAVYHRGEFDELEARLKAGGNLPEGLGNDGERGHLPTSLRYYWKYLEGRGRARLEQSRDTGMTGFRDWLDANYSANTVSTKMSEARQLTKAYGDLDDLYDDDKLEALMQSLRYTAADKAQNRPNPSKVNLTSDLYRDLSNLRTTVNYYKRYRGEHQRRPDREAVNKAIDECAALGVKSFLETYGFGPHIDYWVLRDGVRYPSKAVFGVAHQFMPGGTPLDGKACNGTTARLHLEKLGFEIVEGEIADQQSAPGGLTKPPEPTNLILYGPPGTGKTYATAAEAVRLCDGLAEKNTLLTEPARRTELKQRYDELVEARRIDFVTFHQSYSYEEFVEGLRPVQNASGEEPGPTASGFSLQPEDGVFRRISQRAAASKGGGGRFEIGDRKLFKLSIGEAANPDDDYLFEEAIAEGHALLGYGDIDWSDEQFEDRDAIIAACREYDRKHPDEDQRPPTPQAGRVQCPMIFRNWVCKGDLVIVSKGNLKFRAIGEIGGDYEYVPRSSGVYSHRRKVTWLWVDPAGAPVDDILIGKNFSMRAIYELARSDVNIAALEGYIQSQLPGAGPASPEPYVLIIDEINRGNISKIFGELITLIEPDKRAGMSNALEVRLPYSKTPFSVPANLHLVGTMNTADRSIAQLDTALRRRFVFREVAPESSLLPENADGVPLRRVLERMNDRIEYLVDREHRIGHAFFMGDGGADREAIDRTMRDKVIPLLQEYFFDDWGRIAAVLGEPNGGGFLDCRKLTDPSGQGEDRTSWSVRDTFAPDAYDRLIGKTQLATAEAAE